MDEAACIPVVSLGEALAPSSPHGYEVAHDIGHALALSGAFYVCDHGIPPRTLAEPFEIAQALFAEPPAAPSRWRRRVSAAAATGPGDCFECCSLRSRLEPAGGACAWIGDAPPWLQQSAGRYAAAAARLSRRLMQLLALSLDLPRDAFAQPQAPVETLLRLLCYPPLPPGAPAAGAQAHTDRGALTLLAQDAHAGLEIQAADGHWRPVRPRAGMLLVHPGDRLVAWSGGRYPALRHRVRRTPADAEVRLSVPFFFTPRLQEPPLTPPEPAARPGPAAA